MATKRIVDTGFWLDDKVVECFSPEDKYFMLYLLTNPHTTQLGIYSISPKVASFELGYSVDSVNVLLDRFESKYELIKYSKSTKEVAIKNYLVYSIIKGGKPVADLLEKELRQVKSKSLIKYVFSNLYDKDNLNETVKSIINKYNIYNINNDNDNDNDVSYHDTIHDTDIAVVIFNFWNSLGIIKHQELTLSIRKSINKALKTYSVNEIKTYIERYNTILKDKDFFFNYKWTLEDFLTRKDGISSFTDEGSKWNSYLSRTKKQATKMYNQREYSKEQLDTMFADRTDYDNLDL